MRIHGIARLRRRRTVVSADGIVSYSEVKGNLLIVLFGVDVEARPLVGIQLVCQGGRGNIGDQAGN